MEYFWANFGDPFWDHMVLRGAKMGSKRPLKSLKVATTCICKNLKKPSVVYGFWGSKAVQDSLGRPKKAPKRRLKSSKGFKKVDPKIEPILATFWTTSAALVGPIFGAQNCSRRGPKMGPLLEPRPPGSQGSATCVFRNYTRGVERLLELELYSPKEREG